MKTPILKAVLFFIAMNITLSVYSFASNSDPVTPNATTKTEDVKGQQLVNRLKEIRAMDKSDLSRAERKALRKEVKEIKNELALNHQGVYLSVGAIIIIILLLILLL
ncbi:hypothetical protein ABGT15_12800 [Flavobacterium enshiense]|uniref:hypothetical protein n=1 Tax=Flavobacterium enshiense TaxID=1341165 RepID=UPI00345D371C